MRYMHLHVIRFGVEEMFRAALFQGSPMEVDQFEHVGTFERTSEEKGPLIFVIKGIFNCGYN